MKLIALTLNRGAPARRVVKDGRAFLVAPLSMIVPGVLEGSKGKLYYPPSEVERNPGVWNGVPLTVGHPTDWYGNPVPARGSVVLKRFRIGHVANDRYDGRRRVADGWFDEAMTRDKAPDVYTALLAGHEMELSTGLFTDDEDAPGVAPDGRVYDAVARNYRPDHLAILPNQTGACSIQQGCGLNVNALNPTTNCRRSRPMKRDNPETLDIPVPNWSEYASPAIVRDADRNDKRADRSDDGLPLPTYDWSEIAAGQDR